VYSRAGLEAEEWYDVRMEGEGSYTQHIEQPQPEKWYAPLARVTPFSKYLALGLFVVLPFLGFWLGVGYGQSITPMRDSDDPVPAPTDSVYGDISDVPIGKYYSEGCVTVPQEDLLNDEHNEYSSSEDIICTFKVHNDLPLYTFEVRGSMATVRVGDSPRVLQTLQGSGDEFSTESEKELRFALVDANFDGYGDVRMLEYRGNGSATFTHWLYDPAQRLFVYNLDLSVLSWPNYRADTREVTVHASGGACNYRDAVYKYSSSIDLVLAKEETLYCDTDSNQQIFTVRELKDGALATTTYRFNPL